MKTQLPKRSAIDKWVYRHTAKPTHYVEVKNPPTTVLQKMQRPQDARQVQYNNWSRAKGVYSGSYLPQDHRTLAHQGWANKTPEIIRSFDPNNPALPQIYRRNSTNQWVRYDRETPTTYAHWHWYNQWDTSYDLDFRKKTSVPYYDRYGNGCADGSVESHLGIAGATYVMKSRGNQRKRK